MHLKGILLSALLSAPLFAHAQTNRPVTLQAPSRVIKTDTIVKSGRDCEKLIASALPGSFRGVPLAGHQAYYGPMTDFVNSFCKQYLGAHSKTLSTVQVRGDKHFSLIDNVL